MMFFICLIVMLSVTVAIGLFAAGAKAQPGTLFSPAVLAAIGEAEYLSEQTVLMPVEIFKLARTLADQSDRDEVVRAADIIFESDKSHLGFGRRVSITTLRFMGVQTYDTVSQITVDSLILRALDDQAVWVRFDAAWLAGILHSKDDAVHARLLKMQSEMAVQTLEEGSAEEKLKTKVDAYLAETSE